MRDNLSDIVSMVGAGFFTGLLIFKLYAVYPLRDSYKRDIVTDKRFGRLGYRDD